MFGKCQHLISRFYHRTRVKAHYFSKQPAFNRSLLFLYRTKQRYIQTFGRTRGRQFIGE